MYHYKWSNLTIFGLMLGELILNHTDNLSCTLQKTTISAAQGQSVAKLTVNTLQKIRNDQSFELFWKNVENKASLLGISDPQYLVKEKFLGDLFYHGTAAPEYLQVLLTTTKSFMLSL